MAAAIQMFMGKKNFDCQKAERWFKERRIAVQVVDLQKKPLSCREFESVEAAVGLDAMIEKDGRAYKESPLRFSEDISFQRGILFEDQRLLKTPILRCGRRASVGFKPEIWEEWLRENA